MHLKSFLIKFTFQFHSSSSTILHWNEFNEGKSNLPKLYYNERYPVISIRIIKVWDSYRQEKCVLNGFAGKQSNNTE